MALVNILDESTRLVMVGGKGGVGKTTCATAIAMKAAATGKRVLVISSDPTPSLSDIFDRLIGDQEAFIDGKYPLWGLEISSDVVLKRWKERFGKEIYDVISSFAKVEYDFVDYIGTAPGIEEEYLLSYIIDLVEGGKYDIVVWDTAPAGHTLRLLKLPHLFLKHMEAATKFYLNMYSYLEKIRENVMMKSSKRSLLEIIGSWEALAEQIVEFIRNKRMTKYVLVTIPEALGVRLTERVVAELNENGLGVENIIINNVVRSADCQFHEKRKSMQEKYIDIVRNSYPGTQISILYLRPYEIRGLERISEVAEALFERDF